MNIFSIVVGVVIQCLSTLELTVQRHFCSILKHPHPLSAMAWPGSADIEWTARTAPVYVRDRGFINRRVRMLQSGEHRDYHENAFRLRTAEMFQCLRAGQKLWLDALRFVRRRTMKYKTANTATKRMIQCVLVFTNVSQPSTLEIKSGCTW